MFMLGLRQLGTARTGAYFSLTPFIGATMALAMFRESFTLQLLAARVLMALGLWLYLAERHEHDGVEQTERQLEDGRAVLLMSVFNGGEVPHVRQAPPAPTSSPPTLYP